MPINVQDSRSRLTPFSYTPPPTGKDIAPQSGASAGRTDNIRRVITTQLPALLSGVMGKRITLTRSQPLSVVPAAPRDLSKSTPAAVKCINALINRIENTRSAPLNGKPGTLPRESQAALDQLTTIGEAYNELTAGPMVGDGLLQGLDSLAHLRDQLATGMATLRGGADESVDAANAGDDTPIMPSLKNFYPVSPDDAKAMFDEVENLSHMVMAQLNDRIDYLGHTINDSPVSKAKMYESKEQVVNAAVATLDKAMEKPIKSESSSVLLKVRATLIQRSQELKQAASENAGNFANPKKVMGHKKLSGIDNLLELPTKILQTLARSKQADELFRLGSTSLDTPNTNEQQIIEALLEKTFKQAGLGNDAAHDFHNEMNKLLNAQEWKPIHKEIQLPRPGGVLKVYSEIAPAADMFDSYEGKGFNAHSSTEYKHAVNLARTSLADNNGEVLFSAARHAVVSAFGLVPDEVKHMSNDELRAFIKDLLPPASWAKDGDGNNSLEATVNKVRAQTDLMHTMRAAANTNRAREIVTATLLANPKTLEAALAAGPDGPAPTLDLLSLSLLTPDGFRRGTNNNETMMLADQLAAWKSVSGEIRLTVPVKGENGKTEDKEVKVNVRPVGMNFGVNQGGVKSFLGVSSTVNAVGGWEDLRPVNDAALKTLFGDDLSNIATSRSGVLGEMRAAKEHDMKLVSDERNVRASLGVDTTLVRHDVEVDKDGKPVLDQNKKYKPIQVNLEKKIEGLQRELSMINELFAQIGDMRKDESYRKAGKEPYKMPTRLAVLADALGVNVAFNCKSGKDRTGELDAEAKHLRLQMEETGKVPHYNRDRTAQEMNDFHEVVTHSGNLEMQRLNTGYAGYKLKGVPEIYAQFGGVDKKDDLSRNFLGLSDYTAS